MVGVRTHNGMPQWLDLLLQPGVAPILTTLLRYQHALEAQQLSRTVGEPRAAAITTQALQRLAAYGLVQREDGGTCDEHDPHARYQLTDRGAGFSQAASKLIWFLEERLPARPPHRHLFR